MAWSIPGTEGSSGEFLGRIQYDSRTGFWQTVKRTQDNGGNWFDEKSEPFKGVSLLVDFGTIELGYINLSSPPVFLLVPAGKPYPQQPETMAAAKPGDKPRKAFLPGFRLKVMSRKTFGDDDAYYLSGTSKTLRGPIEQLHEAFEAAPEARAGKIPIVESTRAIAVTTKGTHGTSTFYAPEFRILGWMDRPEAFGERTVPAPGGRSVQSGGSGPAAPPTYSAPPPGYGANHVGPPQQPAQPSAPPPSAPPPASQDDYGQQMPMF